MVFVYLPLYFGIGVILFFAWRLAILWWQQYGRPRRPPAAGAVDGETPDAPAQTGNAAGVLVVSLVAAVVVGLVGFAIGRATLPPSVFDLPIGWGPLGFAIPAVVVGVLAASFFAGGASRTRGAAEADPKEEAKDEWPGRDRSRAILVAASALFLAFTALQYDYKLLGEVTKFSAGPIVSLELAQSPQKGSQGGSQSYIQGQDVATLPRTNGISYVTNQVEKLADNIEKDDEVAVLIAGKDGGVYTDNETQQFETFMKGCGQLISKNLSRLQDEYHSEFPSHQRSPTNTKQRRLSLANVSHTKTIIR
jgi:hypothetical protein